MGGSIVDQLTIMPPPPPDWTAAGAAAGALAGARLAGADLTAGFFPKDMPPPPLCGRGGRNEEERDERKERKCWVRNS